MLIWQAKAIARRWVDEEASRDPAFRGAFFHGSTAWLADDADVQATSDVDVIVVLADAEPPAKRGKFRYQGVLLDVSFLPEEQVQTPEQILGLSHLAGSLRTASVIADPTGRLAEVQSAVARRFAKRDWVRKRCEHAHDKVLGNLRALDETSSFPDQVTAWLFATGVTTHILLVAGLRNPTVRRRYLDVRELLANHDRTDVYDTLLAQLGCASLTQARAERHLAALAETFDAAATVIRTPFPFAADIGDAGRPIAIAGSRELIARGDHREAVFWLVATATRCQQVLARDAPAALRDRHAPAYLDLLGDLGLASPADLRRRGVDVEASLPRLLEVAEAIMAANPDIEP